MSRFTPPTPPDEATYLANVAKRAKELLTAFAKGEARAAKMFKVATTAEAINATINQAAEEWPN